MAEGEFYNKVGLLEEVRRYKTSYRFLEVLYREFNGSERLLLISLGPSLLTITSTITDELYGLDANQGSIDRANDFISHWKEYVNDEPLKTEFDFLNSKRLHPRFTNYHFYLKENFPQNLNNYFDGQLASELFLHLNPNEIKEILDTGITNLRREGKFIFTVYPSENPDSLDEKFYELGSNVGMERSEFIEDGTVNIKKLAEEMEKRHPSLYEANKDKYWLDLEKVKVFSTTDIESLCKDSGFVIKSKEEIRCGMFPFAYRLVYVLNR
jgi:hypothetical protein